MTQIIGGFSTLTAIFAVFAALAIAVAIFFFGKRLLLIIDGSPKTAQEIWDQDEHTPMPPLTPEEREDIDRWVAEHRAEGDGRESDRRASVDGDH